jgi:hypothetical protein
MRPIHLRLSALCLPLFFGGEHFVPFVAKARMRMHRENERACLFTVILRWPRSGPRRMSGPSAEAVALRGSLRSHLRVTEKMRRKHYERERGAAICQQHVAKNRPIVPTLRNG